MESKTNKKRVWRAPTDEDKKMDRCRARNSFEKRAFYVQWCEEWQNWALYSNSNILVRVDEVLSPADGAKEKTDTPYVIIKKERDQLIARRDELIRDMDMLAKQRDDAWLRLSIVEDQRDELLAALKEFIYLDAPITGSPTHDDLVSYWERELSQGNGYASLNLNALSAIAKCEVKS